MPPTRKRVRAVPPGKAVAGLKGGNIPTADPDRLSREFIERGLQYYVSGRYATVAGYLPIAGNLFHHAIEMLLKGCLAKSHTEAQLRSFRHNIKRIWRLFKSDLKDPTLDKLDTTVGQLHKFEEIRYPDTRHGMLAAIYFGAMPGKSKGAGGERHYQLSVTEIDQLVKAVFDHSNFNPMFFKSRFRSEAAEEFFSKWNEHPIWR